MFVWLLPLMSAFIVLTGIVMADDAVVITFSEDWITRDAWWTWNYEYTWSFLTITGPGTYIVQWSSNNWSITIKKNSTGVNLILSGLTLSGNVTAPLLIAKNTEVILWINWTNRLSDVLNNSEKYLFDTGYAGDSSGNAIYTEL